MNHVNTQLKPEKPKREGKKYKITENKCDAWKVIANMVAMSPGV